MGKFKTFIEICDFSEIQNKNNDYATEREGIIASRYNF